MSFSGSLKTSLAESGAGQVMSTSLECLSDGQPFFKGSVVAEWADTVNDLDDNPFLDRIKAVAGELNMEIASYDDLCLAQAMIADGIDDLGHLGQLYAAHNGIELPKTDAFLKAVAAEDRAERAELRKARR
jgi:hypothetical protein